MNAPASWALATVCSTPTATTTTQRCNGTKPMRSTRPSGTPAPFEAAKVAAVNATPKSPEPSAAAATGRTRLQRAGKRERRREEDELEHEPGPEMRVGAPREQARVEARLAGAVGEIAVERERRDQGHRHTREREHRGHDAGGGPA